MYKEKKKKFPFALWLALLPADTGLGWIAFILGVFGFTGVSWHGVHLTWMTEIAGPESAGAASGLWIGSCHLAVAATIILAGIGPEKKTE